MAEQENQFKRNIAYKHRIGDVLKGKPVFNGEKFIFLELGNKNIVRINLIANVVDKYEAMSEDTEQIKPRYSFITLDDGSGQIKAKAFGDDISKVTDIVQGNTILIIGNLRYFNNELYIQPEIAKVITPEYLLIRKLEVEKENGLSLNSPNNRLIIAPEKREQIKALKDTILLLIKESENNGGIDIDKIIMNLKDSPSEIINQEIQRLIEDGIIFEPRPGKLRFLG